MSASRENPLTRPPLEANPDNMNPFAEEEREMTGEDRVKKLAADSGGKISIDGANVEAGLIDIARADARIRCRLCHGRRAGSVRDYR